MSIQQKILHVSISIIMELNIIIEVNYMNITQESRFICFPQL